MSHITNVVSNFYTKVITDKLFADAPEPVVAPVVSAPAPVLPEPPQPVKAFAHEKLRAVDPLQKTMRVEAPATPGR